MRETLSGYIKLYRQFTAWEWYKESPMVHMLVHLIMMANRQPGRWKGVELQRGQLITGRHALSMQTGISERACRTCLERLKATKEIAMRTTSRYTLITVLNYDIYQDRSDRGDQTCGQTAGTPETSRRPQTRKEDIKEYRVEREEREQKENGTYPTDGEGLLAAAPARPKKGTARPKSPKPDFTEGQSYKNPGFTATFCAGEWDAWCRNKKAPYRTQLVAEEALGYLYDLSRGNEARASEALREARISDWQSFHWYFKHLEKQHGHDQPTQPDNDANHHGADNLRWLESHS